MLALLYLKTLSTFNYYSILLFCYCSTGNELPIMSKQQNMTIDF